MDLWPQWFILKGLHRFWRYNTDFLKSLITSLLGDIDNLAKKHMRKNPADVWNFSFLTMMVKFEAFPLSEHKFFQKVQAAYIYLCLFSLFSSLVFSPSFSIYMQLVAFSQRAKWQLKGLQIFFIEADKEPTRLQVWYYCPKVNMQSLQRFFQDKTGTPNFIWASTWEEGGNSNKNNSRAILFIALSESSSVFLWFMGNLLSAFQQEKPIHLNFLPYWLD